MINEKHKKTRGIDEKAKGSSMGFDMDSARLQLISNEDGTVWAMGVGEQGEGVEKLSLGKRESGLVDREEIDKAVDLSGERGLEEKVLKECKQPGDPAPILQVTKSKLGSEAQADDHEAERKTRIQRELDKIEEVQNTIANEELKAYNETFYTNAEDDILTLAELDFEDLAKESQRALQLKRQAKQSELAEYRRRYNAIRRREAESKDELYHQGKLMKRQVERLELESAARVREKSRKVRTAFGTVGRTLKEYLRREKEEIKERYKELAIVDRDEVKKLKVSSRSRPQIVKIRLQVARCLKDKLPKGRYAILCSILDRIGGSPLEFEEEGTSTWRKVSAPRLHSGEYSLNNLRFEKTIHLVVPPAKKLSPSMAYLFELFLLRSKDFAHDQVLAWGVFPLCNSEFELNLGRFKVCAWR